MRRSGPPQGRCVGLRRAGGWDVRLVTVEAMVVERKGRDMTCNEPRAPVRAHRGFSLIELLVVVAIAALLMSMGYTALCGGRLLSKETVCRNNLKQIAAALGLYYNDHKAYPSENLPKALATYVGGSSDVFVCPADPEPDGDSYSEFYVARSDQSTQDYVCGCPRHLEANRSVTLFSSSSTQSLAARPVQWNGKTIRPGAKVGSGVLSFSDGSSVTVPAGMVVRLIQSFKMHDGRLYSLVGVDINETGTLDVEVTPGSRFEVVTPAAIAGVQGTRFQVTVTVEGALYCVRVDVTEGEVMVADLWRPCKPIALAAGLAKKVTLARAELARNMPKKWGLRRNQLADDCLYELANPISISDVKEMSLISPTAVPADGTDDAVQ